MTTRRGFIGGLVASLSAPAIVRPESLMKLFVPDPEIMLPVPELIIQKSANSFLTLSQITKEAVRLWNDSKSFITNVDDQYDELFVRAKK